MTHEDQSLLFQLRYGSYSVSFYLQIGQRLPIYACSRKYCSSWSLLKQAHECFRPLISGQQCHLKVSALFSLNLLASCIPQGIFSLSFTRIRSRFYVAIGARFLFYQ